MTATEKINIKNYGIAFAMLVVLCGLAAAGRAKISGEMDRETKKAASKEIVLVSPEQFQPIRADIVSNTPSKFTIDVEHLANIGADDNAPVFAVYTKSDLPAQCGDFRGLELNYKKPEKYKRVFDLSRHQDVLDAIDSYGCVVMRNIPPKG